MIDSVNKDIEKINSDIEVLPKNNAKNIQRYNDYIEECIVKYSSSSNECEAEIKRRISENESKFKDLTFEVKENTIDYNTLKLSDQRVRVSEKMNIDYLFFKLEHSSSNNLSDENEIIMQIINLFKACGIKLTEKDFYYSENVTTYIKSLLNNDSNIQEIFNNIYWKTPDIIKQIELNIKSIYYKNESKLKNFYNEKYASFDFSTFIKNFRNQNTANEMAKHQSVKYIYDLFINGDLDVNDFLVESRIQDLISSLLSNPSDEKNYENLVKLRNSLKEYQGFTKFEYIVTDFKELFTHREEFKGLFENKLKDIAKKEKNLISLNKKINKTGLFKLKKNKLADTKLERNNLINELVADYEELNDLKIKDSISNYISNETSYYDVLKFTTYNFNYFVKLLEKNGDELVIENIDNKLLELNKFIYDNSCEIINNIQLSQEKDIPKIISEMYKLNSLNVQEDKIGNDSYIQTVDKLLIYYDIYALKINLKDIKFIIDAKAILKKY